MQQIVAIDQIKARSEAIGLSLKRLARAAGVDPTTVYRAARGEGDSRVRTLRLLAEELEREEARVLAHLRTLERSRGGRQLDLVDTLTKDNAA